MRGGLLCDHHTMQVRRARADEAAEIAGVWLRSRAASVPEIPPRVHTEDEVRTWFQEVVLPTREVWVGDDGGAVVASSCLRMTGSTSSTSSQAALAVASAES